VCSISSGKNSFFLQHIKYEFNNLLFQYIFKYYRECSYVTKIPYVNKISFNFCAFSLYLQPLKLCFDSNQVPYNVGLGSRITSLRIKTFICLLFLISIPCEARFYYKLGLSKKPNITLYRPGNILHFPAKRSTLFTMRSNDVIRLFYRASIKRKYSTKNNNFASYLAGLIEGDGSIAVHDPAKNISSKYRPKFIIVFKRADLPLANYLCEFTGCGKVYDKPNRGYVLWQIQETLGVFKITTFINGYMRTPKHEALGRVIDWYNDYIKNNLESKLPATKEILGSIYPLEKKGLDNSAINSNAWLAGFIDTDGNFSISLSKRTKKHLDKVVLYMRLEIKQTYHRTSVNEAKASLLDNNSSFFFIMSEIAAFLNVNVNSRNRLIDEKIFSSFILTAQNQKSLDILREYLTKYPLLSSKYLDYLDWSEVIDFIKEKGNNNVPGGSWELANLKRKDFNKTRTTFTWKHLKHMPYID
jgi:hypothetical protein